jgi:hypothetical protein
MTHSTRLWAFAVGAVLVCPVAATAHEKWFHNASSFPTGLGSGGPVASSTTGSRATKGFLFKVVHAYAFEHADRQDLFQEIVNQIWRSVDAFRGESSVPTWM